MAGPHYSHASLRRGLHDHDTFDPVAALVAYVEAGKHVDPQTGRCKPLATICRELEVSPNCFDQDAVRVLTGASREELRGLPLTYGRPTHLR